MSSGVSHDTCYTTVGIIQGSLQVERHCLWPIRFAGTTSMYGVWSIDSSFSAAQCHSDHRYSLSLILKSDSTKLELEFTLYYSRLCTYA